MVFLSSFESVVSKLEKRSKNRASKKFVFDTRATAKERITRISSNNYNFLIFLSFAFGKDEVGGSNPPSSANIKHSNLTIWVLFAMLLQLFEQKLLSFVFRVPKKVLSKVLMQLLF